MPETPAPAPAAAAEPVPTTAVISAMIRTSKQVSDLIFSPGKPPQVELTSQLVPVRIPQIPILKPEDTARIAADLLGNNITAARKLREEGSCDISYSLPPLARFRVNIFTQRGTCAIVMRVIPSIVPNFDTFNLPPSLREICGLKNGIVLVTGPTGSGKSSTLAVRMLTGLAASPEPNKVAMSLAVRRVLPVSVPKKMPIFAMMFTY